VFQPHLYSRTSQHGEAMGRALAAADLVLVTSIYAAREQPIAGVSSESVVNAARSAGANVLFEADRSQVGTRLQEVVREGDVVVTLGAGDITRVGRELAKWLNAA
jgi:UDP-N-acetylmuramate--alanine ligase